MGILGDLFKRFKSPSANHGRGGNFSHRHLGSVSYDGEQTPGELGPVVDYFVDHEALRLRSWQSFLENQVTQGIMRKFNVWVIGSGLKLQSEPVRNLVGDGVDLKEFTAAVESRFKLFAKSKNSDFSRKRNLNHIAAEAQKNVDVGGDVLVILRVDPKTLTLNIQLIDGDHVRTPFDFKGNNISHGIEKNKRGEVIAYHIVTSEGFKRIKSRDNRGRDIAFLFIGNTFRLDSDRGIPLISASLEDLKMLDRYKSATVGGAEERQKIAYVVEHDQSSTGENPLVSTTLGAITGNTGGADSSFDLVDEERIALTTQKSTVNLPVGSTMKSLSSDMESEFKDFYMTNINLFAAFLGIPPEVALSMYNSNFSASRAALKDWENSLLVKRSSISDQFYQPIYDYWLDLEVLSGRIIAPEYNQAILTNDHFTLSAYRNARFIGVGVPNIDPLKEVKAERAKLGPLGENIPLTTVERATENVSSGEYDSNILQFAQETEVFEKHGFEIKEEKEEIIPIEKQQKV